MNDMESSSFLTFDRNSGTPNNNEIIQVKEDKEDAKSSRKMMILENGKLAGTRVCRCTTTTT